ncbi:MAG: S-adenosylmethionine:tRNA ribosyltransferase-isomerase [Bacteroidales bacterium]|nr:S-adenosylmethionine:tRNA ribosyltransferase-isomerase [Bacteroidales bacterium]
MLSELKKIRIEDYDYPLPDERIARFPLEQRDHSKLLCLRGATLEEHLFCELPDLLPQDTLLVFNDTKVIHARLFFRKETGAVIEVFCLEPHNMPVAQAFEQREHGTWTCFIGNNKKWKGGSLTLEFSLQGTACTMRATRREAVGNAWVVDFEWTGGASFAEVIEAAGVIPLPPYLHREAQESDATRYQTVYAHHDGSVAAPTAGLHFTPEVIDRLRQRGIQTEYITLHVGAGTFKPVSTPTIGEHEMHVEPVHVTADNLRHLVAHAGRPLVAVGTTTVRTLESLYWFGVQLQHNPGLDHMHVCQWDPYELDDSFSASASGGSASRSSEVAFNNILRWMERRGIDRLDGATQLMIAPGYSYRVVDGLVTNFHQPKSTLLLLVSALIGDRWRQCYRYALDHGFRFLSYGDSCLFIP